MTAANLKTGEAAGMSGREVDEQGIARPFVGLVHFCEQPGRFSRSPNSRSSDDLDALGCAKSFDCRESSGA